jgi:hypothetical protein
MANKQRKLTHHLALSLIVLVPRLCLAEEPASSEKPSKEKVRPEVLSPEEGYRSPGFTGGKRIRLDPQNEFLPIPDRWRISMPSWKRYPGARGEYPFTRGSIWNPYNQNVLKGDYAVIDNDKFFVVNLISDTILEAREVPTPRGVSFRDPPRDDFFGSAQQYFINENVVVSLELFKGAAAFRPRDWELRVTPVFNVNYLHLEENNGVDIDVREGNTRTDFHVGFQELFIEKHLSDLTPNYDFWAFRGGIQAFTSDFRGFVFLENQLGARFFGNMFSNRVNWNLAYFHMLEKDTNSGLNEVFSSRDQDVIIANAFFQDFIWKGYTAQLVYHFNYDHADETHFDENGFLRRPSPIGDRSPNQIRAHYFGLNGEGHIGRLNLSNACYFVLGQESHNPIAQRDIDIHAFMAAFEPSIDFDWLRIKGTFFYASGDGDPFDGYGYGFDTIVDNPNFGGAGASYWQRQAIPFGDTFVFLTGRNSFLPSLRSIKNEGQANFVNPGLFLLGGGIDARISQKWRADFNANYMSFDRTEALELLLFQNKVSRSLGIDYSLGVQYRPLLTDNIIVNLGFAVFQPLDGFADIYEKKHSLYSAFVGPTLVY